MGKIDVKSKAQVVQLFTKIQRTATATIVGTEVADFLGHMFVVDIGTFAANDLTVTFQESDDNSAWADIAAADLEGDQDLALVTGLADTVRYTGYKGSKKYIGAKITDGGTGDCVVGVAVVKAFPKDIPANS